VRAQGPRARWLVRIEDIDEGRSVPGAAEGILALLDALGIEDPYDLTGLYHGRPIGEKSSFDSGVLPDRIHLYRRAILDEWIANG